MNTGPMHRLNRINDLATRCLYARLVWLNERTVIEDWFGFHSSDPNTGAELGTKKQLAPNKCGAAEADRTAGG